MGFSDPFMVSLHNVRIFKLKEKKHWTRDELVVRVSEFKDNTL